MISHTNSNNIINEQYKSSRLLLLFSSSQCFHKTPFKKNFVITHKLHGLIWNSRPFLKSAYRRELQEPPNRTFRDLADPTPPKPIKAKALSSRAHYAETCAERNFCFLLTKFLPTADLRLKFRGIQSFLQYAFVVFWYH